MVVTLLQLVSLSVLVFGDIGFDHPGQYGLDFVHGVILAAVYFISFLSGVIYCILREKFLPMGIQALIPVIVFLLFPVMRSLISTL